MCDGPPRHIGAALHNQRQPTRRATPRVSSAATRRGAARRGRAPRAACPRHRTRRRRPPDLKRLRACRLRGATGEARARPWTLRPAPPRAATAAAPCGRPWRRARRRCARAWSSTRRLARRTPPRSPLPASSRLAHRRRWPPRRAGPSCLQIRPLQAHRVRAARRPSHASSPRRPSPPVRSTRRRAGPSRPTPPLSSQRRRRVGAGAARSPPARGTPQCAAAAGRSCARWRPTTTRTHRVRHRNGRAVRRPRPCGLPQRQS